MYKIVINRYNIQGQHNIIPMIDIIWNSSFHVFIGSLFFKCILSVCVNRFIIQEIHNTKEGIINIIKSPPITIQAHSDEEVTEISHINRKGTKAIPIFIIHFVRV